MQNMSDVEEIESKLTDEDEINKDPMIETENFSDSYNLELLFGDTKDDKTDKEVSSDKPSRSKINASNGGTSQDVSSGEAKADSKERSEELEEKYVSFRTMADDAFAAGNFEETLEYLNKAIELIPNDASLYTFRAITNINLCRYANAIEDCETTLQFSENYLKAWLYMARSYNLLGEEELCDECIREAIARNPDDINDIELYEEDFKDYADNS